jgi:DNA-binding transcriptional regulator YiaG
MDQRSRYTEALRAAADTLGSAARLAAYLKVPPDTVQEWLAGRETPPLQAFLSALDVIADGPFAPQHRDVRVAVLPDEIAH